MLNPSPLFDPRRLRRQRRDIAQDRIRDLCASAYLGEGSAVCRVLGRYKMFVDTGDVGHSTHLALDGYWEMWLTEALAEVLKPGMVAVDVGANLGYFTLLMADLVGPSGRVHAFEPNPPTADRLARSIDVNGFSERVRLHRDPLCGDEGRDVILAVPAGEPKNAHLTAVPDAAGALHLTGRRMDSHPELLDADVIKIDAEGAEREIWRGMSGLLARRRPQILFLEFASARYADPGAFLDDIVQAGFSLGVVDMNEGMLSRTRAQILAAPPTIDQMLALRR